MSDQDWRNMSVDLFGFSRNAQIVLEKSNIKTLGELVEQTRTSLRRAAQDGFREDGSGSWDGVELRNPSACVHEGIRNIFYVLQKMGLSLSPSDMKGQSSKNREMVKKMVKREKSRGTTE